MNCPSRGESHSTNCSALESCASIRTPLQCQLLAPKASLMGSVVWTRASWSIHVLSGLRYFLCGMNSYTSWKYICIVGLVYFLVGDLLHIMETYMYCPVSAILLCISCYLKWKYICIVDLVVLYCGMSCYISWKYTCFIGLVAFYCVMSCYTTCITRLVILETHMHYQICYTTWWAVTHHGNSHALPDLFYFTVGWAVPHYGNSHVLPDWLYFYCVVSCDTSEKLACITRFFYILLWGEL